MYLNKFNLKSSNLLKTAIGYYIGVVVNAILNIIAMYMLSTFLKKEEFAVYSLYSNLFLLLSAFNTSWVTQGIYRFNSTLDEAEKILFRKSNAQISLLQGGLVAVIGFSIIALFFKSYFPFLLFLVLLPISNFYLINLAHIQTNKEIQTYWFFEVSRIIIFIFFTGIVLYSGLSNILPLVYLSLAISYFLPSLFIFISEYKKYFKEFSKFSFFETKSIFIYGSPLALWFIFAQLQNVSDRYILAYFLDLKYVGIYSIVYDLVYKSVVMFTAPLLSFLQPIIMEYHNNSDIEKREKILNTLIKVFSLVFLLGGLFLFFFSNFIFHYFGKIENYDCSLITLLIFGGSCIWQMAMIVHKPLEFNKQTGKMLTAITISFLLNFFLNILFIPIFNSLIVPAATTLIGSIVYCVYVFIYSSKSKISNTMPSSVNLPQ